jgi:hypothetical protein
MPSITFAKQTCLSLRCDRPPPHPQQNAPKTAQAPPSRLQVLRRADRLPDRARPDRRGRAERLRQVEPGRGAALGDGRDLAQVAARRRHGRRDLRRLRQPAGAQHAEVCDDDRQRRPQGAGAVQRARDARNLAPDRAREGLVYRINGREVRARDVQILFADASTGARSPALVHQGRSARSSRPSPSSAAACWKTPPASPACMPAATRPSCGSRPPKPTSPASRT